MMFFEQVYRLRKESNLTQEDLAEKCEVSRQAVAKWESGESVPTFINLFRLQKSLIFLWMSWSAVKNSKRIRKK